MIELAFDEKEMDKALARLDGARDKLDRIVKEVVPDVAKQVRENVLEYLDETVAITPRKRGLVKRAVKAVRHQNGVSRFVVASKRLLLGDYDVNPLSVTATKGVPVKNRAPFYYRLRKEGRIFGSLSTLTGRAGEGSIPFIAKTPKGQLRVMYRKTNKATDSLLLAYAPPVQYHAATPKLEEHIRDLSAELFSERLNAALERIGV
jgi:hypothetical protein